MINVKASLLQTTTYIFFKTIQYCTPSASASFAFTKITDQGIFFCTVSYCSLPAAGFRNPRLIYGNILQVDTNLTDIS